VIPDVVFFSSKCVSHSTLGIILGDDLFLRFSCTGAHSILVVVDGSSFVFSCADGMVSVKVALLGSILVVGGVFSSFFFFISFMIFLAVFLSTPIFTRFLTLFSFSWVMDLTPWSYSFIAVASSIDLISLNMFILVC